MSHFTVLVVGDDVEHQLAPYHEFECTGVDNEFVQNIDRLAEARAAFDDGTETRYRDPEGNLHDPYQDRFYRDPTSEELEQHGPFTGTGGGRGLYWTSQDWGDGQGYRAKIHFLPEGWEEVEVPRTDVKDFAEWIEGWYGFNRIDGDAAPDLQGAHKFGWVRVKDGAVVEAVDRTNPNKKWDGYQVGGRWSGHFLLKKGAKGESGKRPLFDFDRRVAANRCDRARKSDIDFAGMRNEAGERAALMWEKMADARRAAGAGDQWETWQEVTDRLGYGQAARDFYHAQPAIVAMRAATDDPFLSLDEFRCSRGDHIKRARHEAVMTFAFLKDRQWAERGAMGWWGAVSDEMDKDEWARWFNAQIDALPDDAVLTVCDCHI